MIKNNEKLQKEAQKEYQIFLKKRNKKGKKRLEADTEISLQKKKRKIVKIIATEKKHLSEEETQEKVEHMKSYYLAHKN